jgi:CheY-like chemotaxis protein
MLAKDQHGPRSSMGNQVGMARLSEAPDALPRKYGVMIVDDEACVRGILNSEMQQQGFAVWLAANGWEALEEYQRHYEAIDVVLMDVCMPRLDGPETLAAFRNINPQVRCCFMSGDLGNYNEERLFDLGAVALISKPFQLEDVSRVLRDEACQARQAQFAPSRGETTQIGVDA